MQTSRDVISDLYHELQSLKRQREMEENMIFDMLKSTVDKIKKDIETERKEREEVEHTILQLLENACEKLSE